MRARAALLAALVVAAPLLGGATKDALVCVIDDVNGPLLSVKQGERVARIASGDRLHGVRSLWTTEGGRARLQFPNGWSLLAGGTTRLQLAPAPSPVLLSFGAVRVENRPGDPNGPNAIVATRLTEVHVPPDGRALITVTRGTGKVPDTLRVVALRGDVTLAPYQGRVARKLPVGHQVTGAGWIPISRWNVRPLTVSEKADLERFSLTRAERAQLPGRPPLIPPESLRLDENPMPRDRTMYLSRADVPPEGQLVVTGRLLLERLPPELGEVYVAASRDAGATWDRLKWVDAHGAFAYHFTPQHGNEYKLSFGVFDLHTEKLFETTGPYGMVFLEAFLPALSDFKVCGQPLPAKGGPYTIYSDELIDYTVLFEGTVRCDAPLSRVRIEVSPDAGIRWRPVKLTAPTLGEPAAGTFKVGFQPVPGGHYRFRVRTVYSKPEESVRHHQTLSEWDAPVAVKYVEARSVERLAGLVRELESALRAGDLKRARALLSPHFDFKGRDLARGLTARFTPGQAAREAGTLQIAVDWERTEASGDRLTGRAIFLYVKEGDYVLIDVLGDDPFAPAPAIVRAGAEGAAPAETVTMGLETTFDFDSRRSSAYSARRIPDDLGFFRDEGGMPVLGTHDRRLAFLARGSLAQVRAVADPSKLEYRAQVAPEEGSVLYLKTKDGSPLLVEVLEAPDAGARSPRLKLAFRFL